MAGYCRITTTTAIIPRTLSTFASRFLSHINSSSSSSSFLLRRGVHVSAYDKNQEEHVSSSIVPDNVIQPQSDEYWAPHPETGVFGPSSTEQKHPVSPSEESRFHGSAVNGPPEDSVLEQKAFFRPLEDLEKPPPQP